MNYLSETTRKERRSLLAAGFVGIVVAQLKIYPTEVDIWGLKFHSPDLPFIVVGSLCAVIGYFLIKFFFSYQFEKSSSTSALLAEQITEGRISLDVIRAEEELDQIGQALRINQSNYQIQQENRGTRIKSLKEQIDQDDVSHTASLKAHDEKISGVREILATTSDDRIHLADGVFTTRKNVEKQLLSLEEARRTYLFNREDKRLKLAENLEGEINNARAESDRLARETKKQENSYHEKREKIVKWKKLHRAVGRIAPVQLVLEVWFPILLGLYAILNLGYLMFHLPPPSNPPIFPVL